MSRPVIVPADPVSIVRAVLAASPVLADVADRIMLVSPRDVSRPWVRLSPIGGASSPALVVDLATLDVAAFVPAETPDGSRLAHDLARRCIGVLRAALGAGDDATGWITRVEIVTGPSFEPDDSRTPPTPRFVFTAYVHTRTSITAMEVA